MQNYGFSSWRRRHVESGDLRIVSDWSIEYLAVESYKGESSDIGEGNA